jgi:hypothetical protein
MKKLIIQKRLTQGHEPNAVAILPDASAI